MVVFMSVRHWGVRNVGDETSTALFAETADAVERMVSAENRAIAARAGAFYECYLAAVEHAVEFGSQEPGESAQSVRKYALLDPWVVARAELTARLTQPAGRVGYMLDLSIELHERCPAVLRGMAAGLLAERTATDIVARLRAVEDNERCRAVAEEVVRRLCEVFKAGRRPGREAIRDLADDVVEEFDPEAVRRRRDEAHRDRGVWFRPGRDGITDMQALLPSAQAEALAERLDMLAGVGAHAGAADADDARTPDQRRADELMALALAPCRKAPRPEAAERGAAAGAADADDGPRVDDDGAVDARDEGSQGDAPGDGDASGPTSDAPDDCEVAAREPAASRAHGSAVDPDTELDAELGPEPVTSPLEGPVTDPAPATDPALDKDPALEPETAPTLRPQITVIVPEGDGETEVHLRKSGRTSLEALEALLAVSTGATFRRTGLGPTPTSEKEQQTYRIPGDLARRVRLRDGTCRHPGCSVRAEHCDIDHVIRFDHVQPEAGGLTVESNLVCLCRTHHRLKTFGGWAYEVDEHGVLTIVTTTGRRVSTAPAGPLSRARARATHETQRRIRAAREQSELNGEREAAARAAEVKREHDDDPPPF